MSPSETRWSEDVRGPGCRPGAEGAARVTRARATREGARGRTQLRNSACFTDDLMPPGEDEGVHRPPRVRGHNASRSQGAIMIRSFRDTRTESVFEGDHVPMWHPELTRRAMRKLHALDSAHGIGDLRAMPGNRLEKLIGDRAGQWSIRVNDRWRICFRWVDGHAENVELVDYH